MEFKVQGVTKIVRHHILQTPPGSHSKLSAFRVDVHENPGGTRLAFYRESPETRGWEMVPNHVDACDADQHLVYCLTKAVAEYKE